MIIKSILGISGICLCGGFASSNLYAATIIDQATGLDSLDKIVIDFGDNLYPAGTIIDTQFGGVTFGSSYEYDNTTETYDALTHGYLENADSAIEPGNILFATDVTAAVFSWRARTKTTFSAWNDDEKVEEFVAETNMSLTSGGRYYGFQDIVFDEIRLSIANSRKDFTLDNLEYVSAIPVPAALWLFGSGLFGLIGLAWRKS